MIQCPVGVDRKEKSLNTEEYGSLRQSAEYCLQLVSCWVLNFKPSHYRSDRVHWREVTAGAVNKSNTSDSQCVCAPQSNTLWTQ